MYARISGREVWHYAEEIDTDEVAILCRTVGEKIREVDVVAMLPPNARYCKKCKEDDEQ